MPAHQPRDQLFTPRRHHRGYQTSSPICKPEKKKSVANNWFDDSDVWGPSRRACADASAGETESSPVYGPLNSVDLRGEAAVEFLNQQVKAGKWKFKLAEAFKAGFDHSKYGEPDIVVTFKFVIDGTEKSCFDHKEMIKSAGYIHYSGYNRCGWRPAKLDESGKVKGFGQFFHRVEWRKWMRKV